MSEMLFRECLREGSRGFDVYVLQIILRTFGCGGPGLVPNGIYGQETTRAVKRLQDDVLGLVECTGEFDRRTITVFGHEFRCDLASIPAYDPTITGL